MIRALAATCLLFVLGSFTIADPPKSEPKKEDKKDELKLTPEEKNVIELTNAERKKKELPPLTANARLMAAARGHARNMATQEKLDHVLDGKTHADRAEAAGYKGGLLGENIAWNQADPKEVLTSWMNSDGHKANILSKDYAEIGVAMAKNSKGEPYWVQVFGAKLGK